MTTPKRLIMLGKLDKYLLAIRDAKTFLIMAEEHINAPEIPELADARSELANASNAIDEAMGLIDELMAPEPTREDMEP